MQCSNSGQISGVEMVGIGHTTSQPGSQGHIEVTRWVHARFDRALHIVGQHHEEPKDWLLM
jgi:hypothetical protein